MTPEEKLRRHNAEFEKSVYQLTENAYLAVGYAASNVGMIVGEDGLIIIDTTESTKAAENILVEFRKITDLPVKTIIYTHSHRDHISGATVFAGGEDVEILAHHAFDSDLVRASDKPGPGQVLITRAARQFGMGLQQGTERINIGLGPADRPMEGLGKGHIPPNAKVATDGMVIERCGVTLSLHFAPGECADNIVVWQPDQKLLFSADNYYTGFPNLYAIRGTAYREFDIWADGLDALAGYDADILAPGHSKPIFGGDDIRERLARYAEAIRFVVAKSAEGMNAGLTPDELVSFVRLPDHLRDLPYLQEYYGTVEWAVRAYFSGTLGWFDGDPATLFPLPPLDEATKLAALVGGVDALAKAAKGALQDDPQWALQLASRVLRIEPKSDAVITRIAAMRTLAAQQSNACARNYYLLTAKQEEAALS